MQMVWSLETKSKKLAHSNKSKCLMRFQCNVSEPHDGLAFNFGLMTMTKSCKIAARDSAGAGTNNHPLEHSLRPDDVVQFRGQRAKGPHCEGALVTLDLTHRRRQRAPVGRLASVAD